MDPCVSSSLFTLCFRCSKHWKRPRICAPNGHNCQKLKIICYLALSLLTCCVKFLPAAKPPTVTREPRSSPFSWEPESLGFGFAEVSWPTKGRASSVRILISRPQRRTEVNRSGPNGGLTNKKESQFWSRVFDL